MATVLTAGLSSCSEDSELTSNVSSFERLSFKVNVAGTANSSVRKTRAASDNKTTWAKGDQIYAVIDAAKSNVCLLEYDGEDWNVSKLSDNVSFNESGKINAVHADKLTFDNGVATTFGDILYTQDGEYKKDGNVVYINLNMNVRPVAKIRIDGIPSGFYIDNLKEYSSLDLGTMTWADTHSEGKLCSESEGNNTCTFYGSLTPNGSNTVIRLVNDNGSYYEREFTGKVVHAGDFVAIDGPLKAEGWKKKIYVADIVSTGNITLEEGGSVKIQDYYSTTPSDATETSYEYKSSDNNVVTVDKDGVVKGIARGTASITIKETNSGKTCDITVTVKNIQDYITARSSGGSIMSFNGLIQYGSKLNWYFGNTSSSTVKLISMQLIDGQTGSAGNEMSVNTDVEGGSSVSYTTTIGLYGIHAPVTCRFKFSHAGQEYTVDAVYE